MRKVIYTLIVGLFSVTLSHAQSPADTTSLIKDRRSNRNVMLNASSASQPRFISLGMPQWGTQIMEDGLPMSMYTDFFPGHWSWHNGLSTETMQVTTLDESALQLGTAGFFASSRSKAGSESFEGAVDYIWNIYGRNMIDICVSTPLGKGWGLCLNVLQDLDRGSNHLDASWFQQKIQYYKAGVSKQFHNGYLKLLYQYMDTYSFNDCYGPFIFVGDGSVKDYKGFRLGLDQYLPSTTHFDYMDVRTGEMRSRSFAGDCSIPMHTATVAFDRQFSDGTLLEAATHLKVGGCNLAEPNLSSLSEADVSDGFTYTDGTPYCGDVQTRYLVYHEAKYLDEMTTVKLTGKSSRHSWTAGANLWFANASDYVSTSNFAYEAKADPQALLYCGDLYYVHNTGAQYFDGLQTKVAAYAQDRWSPSNRLVIRAGFRLEYGSIRGSAANNLDNNDNNTRTVDWNLLSQGVTQTPINTDDLNWAATMGCRWLMGQGFSAEFNAIGLQQHSELWQYGEAQLPSRLPIRTWILRAGINFKNDWIDLQALLTYTRKENNYASSLWTHELTKDAAGYPKGYIESLYVPSVYGMDAWGVTADALVTPFKGFSFHGLFTFRDPRYRNYRFQPVFSDGYRGDYDFSDKQITNTSKVEIELEPSYETGPWRIWLSARYYSKQFINITNTLWFKPRWETFGGVDFKLNRHITFVANVVNFLNQTGASAGIPEASLATDASEFSNYPTAGTFIRPFTIELGVKIRF